MHDPLVVAFEIRRPWPQRSAVPGRRVGGRAAVSVVHDAPTFLASACGPEPACRGLDLEIFFPAAGGTDHGERAKSICARCPLLAACRDWALGQSGYTLHGVWGGMTQQERVRARSRSSISATSTSAAPTTASTHTTAVNVHCRSGSASPGHRGAAPTPTR